MIRLCQTGDFEEIWEIVNDGASAYKGVIADDRWHEPYMTKEELAHEIERGVSFSAEAQDGRLVGIMGIEKVLDVTLVRHAYTRSSHQRQGIGGRLLLHLQALTADPVLIGTWADATWAIEFYKRHGFRVVEAPRSNQLLKKYWSIPDRQAETSIVLADRRWWEAQKAATRPAQTPSSL